MFIVDTERFHRALKEKGYRSVKELAENLGVHRNTIHHYLSGRAVLPAAFERIITALGVTPAEILVAKPEAKPLLHPGIATLIDQLHLEFPNVTFVLFGSRATGRAKKYSDWDLGVFSSDGIDHALYRKIARRKDDLAEDLPYFVDVVNLSCADASFLREASRGWTYLTGLQQDWAELQRKAAA